MGNGRWAMPPLGGDTSWLLCPQGDFVLHRTAAFFFCRVNFAHSGYFSPSLYKVKTNLSPGKKKGPKLVNNIWSCPNGSNPSREPPGKPANHQPGLGANGSDLYSIR